MSIPFTSSQALKDLALAIAKSINTDPSTSGITATGGNVDVVVATLTPVIKKALEDQCKQLDPSAGQFSYPGKIDDLATTIAAAINTGAANAGYTAVATALTTDDDKLTTFIKEIFAKECSAADDDGGAGVPNDIREAAAIANVKAVAEQSAMLSSLSFSDLITNDNLSQQNAVSFQQSMNQIAVTVTAKGANKVSNMSPLESMSVTEIMTGGDIAKDIAELRAVTTSRKIDKL